MSTVTEDGQKALSIELRCQLFFTIGRESPPCPSIELGLETVLGLADTSNCSGLTGRSASQYPGFRTEEKRPVGCHGNRFFACGRRNARSENAVTRQRNDRSMRPSRNLSTITETGPSSSCGEGKTTGSRGKLEEEYGEESVSVLRA